MVNISIELLLVITFVVSKARKLLRVLAVIVYTEMYLLYIAIENFYELKSKF